MNKAQHTPGPWEATGLDSNHFPAVFIGPHLRYIDNSGNGFRAKITINEGPTPEDVANGSGFGSTIETCRANARLIAAAPELYELAQIVASLNPNFPEIGEGMLVQLVSMAVYAIHKVEGK